MLFRLRIVWKQDISLFLWENKRTYEKSSIDFCIGVALSFCESEELPYLKDIQKLIGKSIPVIKEHPFVTADGLKAQKIKTEEIKAKTKENKIYRGSRTNGDFWRRKKQTSQNNTPKGVGR